MRGYFKLLLALDFTALAVCLACRVYLKLFAMDAVTGFYEGGEVYVTIFNVLLTVAPIVMFLSNRLLRPGDDYPLEMRDKLLRALAIAAGLALAAFTFFGPPESLLKQARSETFERMAEYLRLGIGALAALAFLLLGALGVFGRKNTAFSLLTLALPLWQIVYLVMRYNSYTTVTAISDYLLLVLFMLFNALFLMGFARTVSQQMRRDGRNYAIPAGLCASLCGFLLTVPNYIYMAVNRAAMPVPLLGLAESVCVLALSVFALAFSLSLMCSIKNV
jgi:hypothetical protein